MPQYRRDRTEGATYFFTVNALQRGPNGPLVANIDVLRTVFRNVIKNHPVAIDAIVVLPDHIHCVWTLPSGDCDYAKRWSLIKGGFSRLLPADRELPVPSREKRAERSIWQRRYWEHRIRDEQDYWNHLDYIHYNPVKHGYCRTVSQWPHSSFQKFVRLGVYRQDWADEPLMPGAVGER